MHLMPSETNQSGQWAVFTRMRGVLCSFGAVGLPEQKTGDHDAGGHRAVQGEPWPGASVGVRRPETGETPLSPAEVRFGYMRGVL